MVYIQYCDVCVTIYFTKQTEKEINQSSEKTEVDMAL